MATRNGSAKWTGDLKTGSGELTVGEGAWTSAYSGRSRFAGVLPWFEVSEGTNPEELLAAAHAACFSMALSLGLSDAGHPLSSIQTTARVHLRVVGGAPAIELRRQHGAKRHGRMVGAARTRFKSCPAESGANP